MKREGVVIFFTNIYFPALVG